MNLEKLTFLRRSPNGYDTIMYDLKWMNGDTPNTFQLYITQYLLLGLHGPSQVSRVIEKISTYSRKLCMDSTLHSLTKIYVYTFKDLDETLAVYQKHKNANHWIKFITLEKIINQC